MRYISQTKTQQSSSKSHLSVTIITPAYTGNCGPITCPWCGKALDITQQFYVCNDCTLSSRSQRTTSSNTWDKRNKPNTKSYLIELVESSLSNCPFCEYYLHVYWVFDRSLNYPKFYQNKSTKQTKILLKRTDILNSHLEYIIPFQVALLILKVLEQYPFLMWFCCGSIQNKTSLCQRIHLAWQDPPNLDYLCKTLIWRSEFHGPMKFLIIFFKETKEWASSNLGKCFCWTIRPPNSCKT